jgi:hypothetical protein
MDLSRISLQQTGFLCHLSRLYLQYARTFVDDDYNDDNS